MTLPGTLVFLGLLGATTARADGSTMKVRPFPLTSVHLGVAGHGGKLAGLAAGGIGPNLELAVAGGRRQYFLEVGIQRAFLGPEDNRSNGYMRRAGAGVRWLARSFELGSRGTIDMHLEGFAGASSYDLDAMARFVRPDLGVGVGYAIRTFYGRARAKQAAFRISARVFFAPIERETVMAACRGTCPRSTENSNNGLMGVVGGSF